MEIALKVILIIASLGLIAAVLLQKGKSAGLSGAISGGAEHLFGKQKARGLELFLSRLTMSLAAAFFILAVLVAYFVPTNQSSIDLTTPPAASTPDTGAATPPAAGTTTTPPATGTTTPPATGTTTTPPAATPAPATGTTTTPPAAGTTTPPATATPQK